MAYLLAIPIGLLSGLYWAWSASILWSWFVVPRGLPDIGPLEMAGLCLVAVAIRGGRAAHKSENIDAVATILNALFGPLILLLFGVVLRWIGA